MKQFPHSGGQFACFPLWSLSLLDPIGIPACLILFDSVFPLISPWMYLLQFCREQIPISCQLHWFQVWSITSNITSFYFLHLKENALMVCLFVCAKTDCCSGFLPLKQENQALPITEDTHRASQALSCHQIRSNCQESKQINCSNTKQCRKKESAHLAMRNNLFLSSLLWNAIARCYIIINTFLFVSLINQSVIK